MKKARFSLWTSCIAAFVLMLSLFVSGLMPVQAADSSEIVDDFLNFDLTSSKNGVWEIWNNHAESGLSVVGRGQITYPNYVTYKFAGKVITGFSLDIQYYPDFCAPVSSLVVSARTAGSTEWTTLNFTNTDPASIPGFETGNFKTSTITLTDAIPTNTVEVKIELINDVTWTIFLDKLTLTTQTSSVKDELPGEEEPEVPVKEYDFTADMTDFDDVAEKSDNWEIHAPHPESLMNVYGKTNGKTGYVVYKKNGQDNTLRILHLI